MYKNDPSHKSREESAIMAYAWYHFIMNTSDPDYIVTLPMTKVREVCSCTYMCISVLCSMMG